MGRSISINTCAFMGTRVTGQLTYIPFHHKHGKPVNQKVIIDVGANGAKKADGTRRLDYFTFMCWGKLADICCRSLGKGTALDVVAEAQSYHGKLFNKDGSLRLDMTGQPIEVQKTSFTIEKLIFGEESEKQIAEEVQLKKRPAGWRDPASPDFQKWLSVLKAKQTLTWNGGPVFGYARVVRPTGDGIYIPAPGTVIAPAGATIPTAQEQAVVAAVQAALGGGEQTHVAYNPMTGQVEATGNEAAVAAMPAVQPVAVADIQSSFNVVAAGTLSQR